MSQRRPRAAAPPRAADAARRRRAPSWSSGSSEHVAAPHRHHRDGDGAAAVANLTYCRWSRPTTTAPTRATSACCSTSTPASAARSPPSGQVLRLERRDQRPAPLPARLPRRAGVRPDHRLLLGDLRLVRPGAGRGRDAQRQRRPAVRAAAGGPLHRPRPPRRQRGAHDRPGGAEGRLRPAHRASATRARWSRSSPPPGPSWRWSPRRRSTPTCWPATTPTTQKQAWADYTSAKPPVCSTGRSRPPTRRARRSSWSTRPPRCERQVHRRQPGHRRAADHAAGHPHHAGELQRQRVRHQPHGQPARGAAALLQHRVRRPRRAAGRAGHPRAVRRVRDRSGRPGDPAGGRPVDDRVDPRRRGARSSRPSGSATSRSPPCRTP